MRCETIEAWDTLIPYICGPFKYLGLRGGPMKWKQLKNLVNSNNVKGISLLTQTYVTQDEIADFFDFQIRYRIYAGGAGLTAPMITI
uniref:RIBORED_LARGE domain-containing protein n=1 Tax=Panagrellus redivivus TaxID=6233 RepID=A0A7E5A1B1_PANRE